MGRIYTVSSIAESLDVSSKTARRIIETGELKAHRIGRQWRVFEPDLQEYLAKQSNRSNSEVPAVEHEAAVA